ncbi:MAG: hypothetical protein U9N59_02840 [Campylobacterota bacterium]|nr:hypothetical protein [Campylobacterota bacterium]
MKYTFILIAIFSILFSNQGYLTKDNLKSTIKILVNNINKMIEQSKDKTGYLQTDEVSYLGRAVFVDYKQPTMVLKMFIDVDKFSKLSGLTKQQTFDYLGSKSNIVETTKQNANLACSTPSQRGLLEYGALIKHYYYSFDKTSLLETQISIKNCK